MDEQNHRILVRNVYLINIVVPSYFHIYHVKCTFALILLSVRNSLWLRTLSWPTQALTLPVDRHVRTRNPKEDQGTPSWWKKKEDHKESKLPSEEHRQQASSWDMTSADAATNLGSAAPNSSLSEL